ncbi:MAG: hypothetical protein KDG54_18465 [Geminicoccaceae bacterium]|nr:hypothetical protein [Geminicoccaceae bacterium]
MSKQIRSEGRGDGERSEALARQMRDNLRKRKQQTRQRAERDGDGGTEGATARQPLGSTGDGC